MTSPADLPCGAARPSQRRRSQASWQVDFWGRSTQIRTADTTQSTEDGTPWWASACSSDHHDRMPDATVLHDRGRRAANRGAYHLASKLLDEAASVAQDQDLSALVELTRAY